MESLQQLADLVVKKNVNINVLSCPVKFTNDIFEFIESPEFMNFKLRTPQRRVIETFYETDIDGTPKYNVLVVIAGMRGGKSAIGSFIGQFGLHQLLKLDSPQEYWGLLPGDEIFIVNTANSKDQSSETIYAKIKGYIHKTKWWQKYIAWLQEREIKESTLRRGDLFTENVMTIHFKEKNVIVKAEHSNSASLAGKCVVGDTYIITKKGFEFISNYCPETVSEEEKKISIYGINSFLKTSKAYNLGESDTIKIKTRIGLELEGTPEHPILVLTSTGDIVFKPLQELTKNDYCCILYGKKVFPKEKIVIDDIVIDEDFGTFLGLMISEGTLSHPKGQMAFSNKDKKLVKFVTDFYKKFGINLRYSGSGVDYECTNLKFRNFLEKIGVARVVSKGKEVPWVIMQSPASVVKAFLRALFEGDGSPTDSWVEYCSASKKLIDQIQLLLLNFGIISYQATIRTAATNGLNIKRDYYQLSIHGENLDIFNKEISFLSERKKNKLVSILEENTFRRNHYKVFPFSNLIKLLYLKFKEKFYSIESHHKPLPFSKKVRNFFSQSPIPNTITFSLLKEFLDSSEYLLKEDSLFKKLRIVSKSNFFFDKISNKAYSKNIVYDFTVPKEHLFYSNGFISHNTIFTYLSDEICRADTAEDEIQKKTQKRSAQAVFNTLQKGTQTFGMYGKTVVVSSPYYEDDYGMQLLYSCGTLILGKHKDLILRLKEKYKKPEVSTYLGFHFTSKELNPKLDDKTLFAERQRSPKTYDRDFEAIPPKTSNPFFEDEEIINRRIVDKEYLVTTKDIVIEEGGGSEIRTLLGKKIVGIKPDKLIPRYVCCDQGVSSCAFVIGMGHSEEREFQIAEKSVERLVTVYDTIIIYRPNKDLRVSFSNVEDIIKELNRYFFIKKVTYDQWQSVSSIQNLFRAGIHTEVLGAKFSMYEMFYNDLFSGLVDLPNDEDVLDELRKLKEVKGVILPPKDITDVLVRLNYLVRDEETKSFTETVADTPPVKAYYTKPSSNSSTSTIHVPDNVWGKGLQSNLWTPFGR